jgi:AcrR family transcriptional regulator
MPKGFTEREKTIIRAKLLAAGTELFSSHGLRKTNVEELTQAAGISKGAFYLFFDSKEELFFDLLEQFETEYRANMLRDIARDDLPPRERFRAMLRHALVRWRDTPLLARFGQAEYELLARKLPEQRVEAQLQSDIEFSAQFIAACHAARIAIDADPKLVTGLMRAIVFLSLHEQDIGADVHADVVNIMIDQVANYLVKQ